MFDPSEYSYGPYLHHIRGDHGGFLMQRLYRGADLGPSKSMNIKYHPADLEGLVFGRGAQQ